MCWNGTFLTPCWWSQNEFENIFDFKYFVTLISWLFTILSMNHSFSNTRWLLTCKYFPNMESKMYCFWAKVFYKCNFLSEHPVVQVHIEEWMGFGIDIYLHILCSKALKEAQCGNVENFLSFNFSENNFEQMPYQKLLGMNFDLCKFF